MRLKYEDKVQNATAEENTEERKREQKCQIAHQTERCRNEKRKTITNSVWENTGKVKEENKTRPQCKEQREAMKTNKKFYINLLTRGRMKWNKERQ